MSEPRSVILVTDHDDTAELYQLGLEQGGFTVQRWHAIDQAVDACRRASPIAVIVHFTPRHDPAAAGVELRAGNPGTVLIGLFSIQLPVASLKRVLDTFDDVIIIPCSPDALVARLVRLQERKRKQASA